MKTLSTTQTFHYKKNVEIHYAQENDFDQIEHLIHELMHIHSEQRPDLYKEPKQAITREDFAKRIENKSILVAEYNKKIVGVLRYLKRVINYPEFSRTVLFVDGLIVVEEFRRLGIATQLLEQLKIDANKIGANTIELNVDSFNSEAMKFYLANKFQIQSTRLEFIL